MNELMIFGIIEAIFAVMCVIAWLIEGGARRILLWVADAVTVYCLTRIAWNRVRSARMRGER